MTNLARAAWVFASALTLCACTLLVETGGLMRNEAADAAAIDAALNDRSPPNDAGGPVFTADATCPSKGGDMVNVGTHCIDLVEVSVQHYDTFTSEAGAVEVSGQPSFCAFNTDLRRGESMTDTPPDIHPVVAVDWCDAFAFCKWAGKRLCGAIGGGATPFSKFSDPAVSQWQNACTSNGENDWVYGDAYDGTACRGIDYDDAFDYVRTSRTAERCRGSKPPLASVYDLCGNAAEWEDSCETSINEFDKCRIRGGARQDDQGGTRCDADAKADRSERSIFIGFRCCWP